MGSSFPHVSSCPNTPQTKAIFSTQLKHEPSMCGFPDKLVIATLGNYVVSVYGDEELVNTFRDKLQAAYSDAAIAYDEMIGEGEFSDGEDTALEAPVA